MTTLEEFIQSNRDPRELKCALAVRMKIDRHDQAKILSPEELSRLFTVGLKTARDRALFGVCLYTGTRIAKACSLHTKDVYAIDGSVRPRVTICKGTNLELGL